MPIDLESTPVTNSLNVRITLMQNGTIRATLEPEEAKTLSLRFDQVGQYNPGHPPVVRMQNPNVGVTVSPGHVGYFSIAPGAVLFHYARPGQQEITVRFT